MYNRYTVKEELYRPVSPDVREKPPAGYAGGPSFLRNLLPPGTDVGDIILLLVLYLLYADSRDEDFLVILIVMAAAMLR